jgi:hypothetical protein
MSRAVVLESEALRVTVNPGVGGTITEIRHKAIGLSVLGTTPWDVEDSPLESFAAPDERTWLTRYTGGWPLLFPNGGDACHFEGGYHGFHGEASISPWRAEAAASTLRLTRRFHTVPVHMQRDISVEGDLVVIREIAEAVGPQPVKAMWGHHPTFGSDLLDGEFEIQTGARTVSVDQGYDPPANPLLPGATGRWPMVQGKAGMVDLSRPGQGAMGRAMGGAMAALAFLRDFDSPWISIRRLDDAVAVALSWDAATFPYAWLWCELGGTPEAPWFGQARLIGLEPNSTCFAGGIAEAQRRGERLLTLQPGIAQSATIRLQVFKPRGPVQGIDDAGRAL